MADLTTLENWLTEAELARHNLLTLEKEVTVSRNGRSITYAYSPEHIKRLDNYIASLKSQIASLKGDTPVRRPIYLSH